MDRMRRSPLIVLATLALSGILAIGGAAISQGGASETGAVGDGTPATQAILELPFPDNPDPDACGIPQRVGSDDTAWLHGEYEGEVIEPIVHMYDSHLRREVTGRAPSGTQVHVNLFQHNPVLDFYMVEAELDDGSMQKGWVPAPFLVFEEP